LDPAAFRPSQASLIFALAENYINDHEALVADPCKQKKMKKEVYNIGLPKKQHGGFL